MKPLIGITGFRHTVISKVAGPSLLGVHVSDDYAHGVETAGGIPLVIPYLENRDSLRKIAEHLDGLLLSGGEDVDPAYFGEEPKLGLQEVIPARDTLEMALISEFVAAGKPILGICRGLQVLNAAFGGTLYQDLPRQWRGETQHSQTSPRSHLSHTIQIEPDSRLYHLLGENRHLRCNSFHHQAIKEVGHELKAVAWDAEGLVEAIEHPDHDFLVAVQWHPENLWRTSPEFLGLFQGFVDAAKRSMPESLKSEISLSR